VFVPMFRLGGVAGYLFRPMAEAVVFALMASYVLSRTLVNTMARYLLANQATHGDGEAAAPTRNPFVMFQRGFEHRFERTRAAYRRLLATALGGRRTFIVGFLAVVAGSFALTPFLGQNFFPPVEGDQIKLHVRAQTGTRIEETARLCDRVEAAVRATIPPDALVNVVDNIGLPISGINAAYGNSGTIGANDADILISVKPDWESKVDDFVTRLRERLPRQFPGTSFAFLPADIVTQILNFGLPSPIDVQIIGPNMDANRVYADALLRRVARVSGVADARIQQAFNAPTLNVTVDRARASQVGLSERDVATSLQDTLAGSIQTAPTFWLNPKNGVSYPIVAQSPQYWLDTLSGLETVPASQGDSKQLLGGVATVTRGYSDAVVSHYAVQPVIDIFATNHERDLGAVSHDIQNILDETAKDAPPGSTVVLRGQTSTMTYAFTQLYAGLALAIVLIYLLIVVNFQSWLDPFVIVSALPTALAGIVWMLFVTRTTLSVPALTGAIMCMGVATANSILVVSFARERLADGADALTAAIDAGFTRFRPVLMTALAMIIGMAPMALSAEQNAPLGRAVIGGLICSTVATLFFVPAVFRLVHARLHGAAPDASPGLQAQAEPI
jgi:multidrug efflux pump subunit AcrB